MLWRVDAVTALTGGRARMIQRIAIVAAMAAGFCVLAHGATQAQALLPPTGSALPTVTAPSGQKSRGTHPTTVGTVIRGADTVSLIATLPWWRVDEQRPPDPAQLESPILTACDLWLGFPFATSEAQSLTVRLAAAQRVSAIDDVANRVEVGDPGALNDIDLAAPEPPRNTLNLWWLGALLLALAGAAGAFAAARRVFA
jgi:hypothetical protein